MREELENIEFDFCKAIQNGILHLQKYPIVHVNADDTLTLTIIDKMEKYEQFVGIFPSLCKRHDINKLSGKDDYISLEKLGNAKYSITFNISIEDLEIILMTESDAYRGYRNASGAGSLLLLANPDRAPFKENVICLFPVYRLDNDVIIPRIAGCNTAEIVIAQLTFFVTKYLPPSAYQASTERYSHWGMTTIADCILTSMSSSELVTVILEKLVGVSDKKIYIQELDGSEILSMHKESVAWVREMNHEAMNIYRLLGVVSSEELKQLQSFEVPIRIILNELEQHITKLLKNYEPGGEKAPGGCYYYPEQESFDKKFCAMAKENLTNIRMLLQKINEEQKDEVSKLEASSRFRFFDTTNPSNVLENPEHRIFNR